MQLDISKLESEKEEIRKNAENDKKRLKVSFDTKIEELSADIEKLSKDYTTVSRELQEKNQIAKTFVEMQESLKKREENLNKTKITISKLKNAFESFELSFACSNCSELQNEPVLLLCGHSICEKCASKGAKIRCERCKKDTDKSQIAESNLIREITVKFKYSRQCLSELDVFPV